MAARRPGDRLSSSRRLVEQYRVSPVTVSKALRRLALEGLVESRSGAGTFVADRPRADRPADLAWQTVVLGARAVEVEGLSPLMDPPDRDEAISLATGYLHPSLTPERALATALARAARSAGSFDRPPAGGLHALRSWFARFAAPGLDARDVTVTNGGQAALSTAFRALVPAGEPLLMESPTYPGALAAARAAGIHPVPVPLDEHGLLPGLLDEAFSRTGARALYCQPTFHNPTGALLAAGRREEVLAVAAAASAFVVEDDCSRLLGHGRQPPPPLVAQDREGRVVYLTSLTKAASPSLRVGALVARGPVARRLAALSAVDELFVSKPLQECALLLVSSPAWPRHLAGLAHELGARREVVERELAARLPGLGVAPSSGGVHLWARLADGAEEAAVVAAARREGVVVMGGRAFHVAEEAAGHLRLTLSAAASQAELADGVRRLATAVRRVERAGGGLS